MGAHRAESRFEELKRYVAFGEVEAQLLAALKPIATPHFPRIAQSFYDRIREHEDAHAVFTGEAQIERLQGSMVRWLDRLLSGRYDEAYFKETLQIGRVHVKVGLPQRYMLTAMALIRLELTRLCAQAGDAATATREAIERLLDLELAIMLEGYHDDFVARAQRIERLEKQELNRALVQTEHRYVNAVELARVLIVGLDARGEVRLFNREAERVTGFARDEVIGASFAKVLVQEDLVESIEGEIRRAARGDQTARRQLECAVRTKSGKYRDLRWQLAYAASEVDDEIVLFAIGHDMTEEIALKERTMQHERLAAVGTLAAGLAHEIRNPLNGAQLHIDFLDRMLRKGDAPPAALEAVHVIGDEITRLATLVTEFLDFARPRPPQLRPTSARALADRALKLVASNAASANVTLALDFPTRDPQLNVDPAKIEQVLLNLLTNAIESVMTTGGGHVTLRVRRQPRSVTFEVQDDGPGLSTADAPIFDAFFSTKANGTGLGLAITHRIVTDHGGDVTVESRPGNTVFRVLLPLDPE
ncbi:MAG: protoglobin domain-containing protein [Polyangiaceae bacterium]